MLACMHIGIFILDNTIEKPLINMRNIDNNTSKRINVILICLNYKLLL